MTILFLALALSGQMPDANELLKQVAQVQREQTELGKQYFFRRHFEAVVLDSNGKPGKPLATQDWETVFLGGAPYSVLKRRNGKALGEVEAKAINDAMRQAFEEHRSYSTGSSPMSLKMGTVSMNAGSLQDLIRLMRNNVVREEDVNGRKAWVLTLEPPGDADTEILSYRHTIWIDQEDKAIVRREMRTAGPLSKLGPNGYGLRVYTKQEGKPWLVSETATTSPGTYYFKKVQYLNTEKFTDYKKFDATTTITFDPQ